MALSFQSLRSSSSGNCLMVWTEKTTVLLDCGIRVQRECDRILSAGSGLFARPEAVLVSHAHSDHICYAALRVLQRLEIPIQCHRKIHAQIHEEHVGDWESPPPIQTFGNDPFTVGELSIQAIELPHAPGFTNVGFAIEWHSRHGRRKMVACTDFYDGDAILDSMIDADFIFVEANHDPELLRRYPNYASRFHMSNAKTAKLLSEVRKASRKPPQAVVLGHLSRERNTESLAIGAIHSDFERAGVALDFRLEAAPREKASAVIRID